MFTSIRPAPWEITALVLACFTLSSTTTSPALAGSCASTPAQTEGPYYRTPTPETNHLVIGSDAPLLTLHGRVVDTNCNPIPYSWLDIWHANPTGAYDNTAPYDQYRGHFFTDASGEFTLYDILPGLYPGRTRHTHVKVDAANTAVLTTQIYFPGEPLNASDSLYNPLLQITMTQASDGSYTGSYTFVLPTTAGCTAPSITSNPEAMSLATGGIAMFTVGASGSTPMTYRWRRNGVPLQDDARIEGVATTMLMIYGVTCDDAGIYDAQALSSCGTATTTVASLTVTDCCRGDLNGDSHANGLDVAGFVNCLTGGRGGECTCADLSGNGTAGPEDVSPFVAMLLQ